MLNTVIEKLIEDFSSGSRAALARMISKVENRDPDLETLMKSVYPLTGHAEIWGITGPPGAGKSTTVDRLIAFVRSTGRTVAVIAVDPSSPFTGGAILGDRIRMQEHASDPGVYIRSLGTRGQHGGLSAATREVIQVLDAAKFDVILVETAGVGQTELDILRIAQTVVVVLVPESGDSIQVMKAGLMEIADLFVVNKADRPEADKLCLEITQMVGLSPHDDHSWLPPVLKTEALRDIGIQELANEIGRHQTYLTTSGQREKKRVSFLVNEIREIYLERMTVKFQNWISSPQADSELNQLANKNTDPYQVVSKLTKLF